MKKIIALIALISLYSSANAAPYLFTVNDGINIGNGTLHVNSSGFVTSGNLVVSNGTDSGSYSLFQGGSGAPSATLSPASAFNYDNVIYSASTPGSSLDWYGLLFVGNGLEINIWGNGAGNPFSFYSFNGSYYNVASTTASFNLQPVPVPAAIWLFSSALMGFLGLGKSKQKS